MNSQPGKIIVNADDFGHSSLINAAIVSCFQQHLISSTTIMANMPGFEDACSLAISNGLTDRVGIHLNLTEGQPLVSKVSTNLAICDASGYFRRRRPRLLSKYDRAMIAEEVAAQITRCHDAGLRLTHADSHQHVHNEPMVFLAIRPVLKQFGISRLRISRNMDALPATSFKRIAKTCFNRWIESCGLRTSKFFGSVKNFEDFRTTSRVAGHSFEILTHPSFNKQGVLVDHLDNLPLVDRLTHAFRGMTLSGFSENEDKPLIQGHAA